MKKIKLFIAMSLDGYIADCNGGVGWLSGHGSDEENMDSYSAFVEDIDTIIMGYNTYNQIVTELSPTKWIYDNFTTYVITSKNKTSTDKIKFCNQSPKQLLNILREKGGKDIWICGGANIVQQLVKEDLIDEYYVTVIPTILGCGIRLFDYVNHEIQLKLVKTQSYNGMVDLVYTKR